MVVKTKDAGAALSRWEDKRELKNLMGKYANLIILNRDHEVYDMLWSKGRKDTAFGTNDGWYAGDVSVRGYYDARYKKNKKIVSLLYKKLAAKFEGKTEEDLYGIGVFRSLPVSCPVIEVAGDGKTAKGLWVCQGGAADLYPYGPASRWIWGYYAVDFIRENGEWRIWRLLWIEDLSARNGTNWGQPEVIPPDLPEFAEIRECPAPAPDVAGPLWTPWSPGRKAVAPAIPQPYANYAAARPELAGIPLPVPALDAGEPAPNTADAASASEADLKLLQRVLDEEEVRTLVNRRVYYIFAGKRREEIADLWVRGEALRKRASFGKNWGWYKGMDAVEKYYVNKFEQRLDMQMRANGKTERQAGNFYAHPVTTPVIEIADDGGSARGLWYCIAQETWSVPGGTAKPLWMMEKLAIDFIKEEGEWRILNVMNAVDLSSGAGEDYSKQPVYLKPEEDPIRMEFGEPAIPELAHDNMFNWWDNYPAMPEPYATFSDNTGYGPEGWRPPSAKGLSAGEGRNRK